MNFRSVHRDHGLTVCSINMTHTDAEIECSRGSVDREVPCTVKRARHSKGYPITMVDNTFDADKRGIGAIHFFDWLPELMLSYHAGEMTPIEAYLADPLSGGISKSGGIAIGDAYTKLLPGIFEARLTVMLNTALRGTYGYKIVLGTDGTDISNKTGKLVPGSLSNFGNATGSWSAYSPPVYRLHMGWLALYVVSIAVLVLCVLVTIVLRARIHAPDFLSSVSALVRDSPYVNKPDGGSLLDGTQLANLLGRTRVRIGGVRPDEDFGKIAFAEEEMVRQRLRPGRLYI